jgi:2-polyprenyl-3-methyl-5-hydroxy-6-metoxy-1,4-benzoquinol methylase
MKPHSVQWDAAKISKFWDFMSAHGEAEYFSSVFARDLANEIMPIVEPNGEVLDLGCGIGDLLLELSRRGLRVRGIDSSPESIDIARKRLSLAEPDRLVVGTLTSVPLPDECADIAVLVEVVEHLLDEDLAIVLHEALRVTRTGGRIFVSTPNMESLSQADVGCPSCGATFHRVQHVRRWTPESIVAALESAGFRSAKASERQLIGDRTRSSRWRRRVATIRHRSVLCPDCGTVFNRPLRRPWSGRTPGFPGAPHLLATATKP